MNHFMFWRIDKQIKVGNYIALRHYDENARNKINEEYNERKRVVYKKLRIRADKIAKEKVANEK